LDESVLFSDHLIRSVLFPLHIVRVRRSMVLKIPFSIGKSAVAILRCACLCRVPQYLANRDASYSQRLKFRRYPDSSSSPRGGWGGRTHTRAFPTYIECEESQSTRLLRANPSVLGEPGRPLLYDLLPLRQPPLCTLFISLSLSCSCFRFSKFISLCSSLPRFTCHIYPTRVIARVRTRACA